VQTLEFGFGAAAANCAGVGLRDEQPEQDGGRYFLQV
jgi:hypothetical protein